MLQAQQIDDLGLLVLLKAQHILIWANFLGLQDRVRGPSYPNMSPQIGHEGPANGLPGPLSLWFKAQQIVHLGQLILLKAHHIFNLDL